ncbi:hypothetical protein PHYPSEUDO_015194 [Phytophthora pseudosyringae]|uniref:Uncharacterized protein n=1 Tax=Phytophthora pseudosyringae TaxID=221518 RepID=A0A8T1V3F5_9STRA|nr:hypothetical protein PHYPSEUDO_015194 [Phytophthora pseudosyringae]
MLSDEATIAHLEVKLKAAGERVVRANERVVCEENRFDELLKQLNDQTRSIDRLRHEFVMQRQEDRFMVENNIRGLVLLYRLSIQKRVQSSISPLSRIGVFQHRLEKERVMTDIYIYHAKSLRRSPAMKTRKRKEGAESDETSISEVSSETKSQVEKKLQASAVFGRPSRPLPQTLDQVQKEPRRRQNCLPCTREDLIQTKKTWREDDFDLIDTMLMLSNPLELDITSSADLSLPGRGLQSMQSAHGISISALKPLPILLSFDLYEFLMDLSRQSRQWLWPYVHVRPARCAACPVSACALRSSFAAACSEGVFSSTSAPIIATSYEQTPYNQHSQAVDT